MPEDRTRRAHRSRRGTTGSVPATRRFRAARLPLAMALLGLLVSGCAARGPAAHGRDAQRLLLVSSQLRFDDVPVPSGFELLPDDSFTFQNQATRVGVLKYRGRGPGAHLVAFYQDQMPLYNWDLISIIEYGPHILNFEQPEETCVVMIEKKGRHTILTIALGPRAHRPFQAFPLEQPPAAEIPVK